MEMHKEEIKSEQHSAMDGNTYSHPSYGMIKVNRRNSSDEYPLFGAEVSPNNYMAIMISKAQVTQDLGRNWYYSTETVTEAHLSPVQYAELISNPNTEGVPCTLYKTQEHGFIEYKPIDSVTQHVESVIDEKVADLKKRASSFAKDIMDIAGQKGGLKKDDKEQIIELARKLQQDLCSNMSFYEKSIKESIEKTKLEAKTEIKAYMTHAINTAGLKALENPETLKLVFKDET